MLQLDDTPHAIALGAAIGMFIGWTPTVGAQMLLVVAVAFLAKPFFRFNQFAALVGVYVSNPVTTVPMYWAMYKTGAWLFPGNVTYDRFEEVLTYKSFAGWWNTVWTLFVDIGAPLLVGSLILATVFALLTYPAMRWLLKLRRPVTRTSQDEVTASNVRVADVPSRSSSSPDRAPVPEESVA